MVLFTNAEEGQPERRTSRERERVNGSLTRRQLEPPDQEGNRQQYDSPSNMLMDYQQPQLVPPSFHASYPPFLDNTSITNTCTQHQDLSSANYPEDILMKAYYMNQLQLLQLYKAQDAERLPLDAFYRNCGIYLQNNMTGRLSVASSDLCLNQSYFFPYSFSRSVSRAAGSRDVSPQQTPTSRTHCVTNDGGMRTVVEQLPIRHRPTTAPEDYIRRPRHYMCRPVMSLNVEDSDISWLSKFLCFVRKDCLEVFEAEQCDVFERKRTKQIVLHQVGVRCRFCAHLEHCDRIQRSSMFPSKIDGIYNGLPVLIRNHLSICPEMPKDLRSKYTTLKGSSKRDGLETKSYWKQSAQSIGIVEREKGIFFQWRH